MDDECVAALCDGLDEEIRCYEEMLGLAREEQRLLGRASSAREVVPLASRKLQTMRHVADVSDRLTALKMRWKRGVEEGRGSEPRAAEVDRRLERMGDLLRELLDIDLDNQRVLAGLIGRHLAGRTGAPSGTGAARAYGATDPGRA